MKNALVRRNGSMFSVDGIRYSYKIDKCARFTMGDGPNSRRVKRLGKNKEKVR